MTARPPIPHLMLVTDRRRASMPLPKLVRLAVAGGVDAVQLREPDLDGGALACLGGRLVRESGEEAQLLVNGSVAVAEAIGAGVHLPERMLESIAEARDRVPGLVGVSVHSPEAASRTGVADYLIAGHVYETGSHPGEPPLGLDGLRAIVAAAPAPVLAIGGITPERVPEVIAASAHGVAVLSAINGAADPSVAAAAFRTALEQAMSETTQTPTIALTINGKPVEIPAGSTVLDYLTSRGHHDRMVVVELNGTIIRRPAFADATLSTGDKVEIVHFVGGG